MGEIIEQKFEKRASGVRHDPANNPSPDLGVVPIVPEDGNGAEPDGAALDISASPRGTPPDISASPRGMPLDISASPRGTLLDISAERHG